MNRIGRSWGGLAGGAQGQPFLPGAGARDALGADTIDLAAIALYLVVFPPEGRAVFVDSRGRFRCSAALQKFTLTD